MEWIKVSNRLPEKNEDEELLVFGKDGISIGRYLGYWHSEKWCHAEFLKEWEPVTHWMALPEWPPHE